MSVDTARRRRRHPWARLLPAAAWMLFSLPLELGLRVLGYRRVIALIDRCTPARRRRASTVQLARAAALADGIAAAAGLFTFGPGPCLRQSILLYAALRLKGLAPVLKIGASKLRRQLSAHAWVELDGVELLASNGHLPFPPARS